MAELKQPSNRSIWVWIVGASSLLALLLPWLRNRAYVRDFFDYGLMVTTAGRLNAGEKPYVDFSTAMQPGSYWVNAAAEWLWGPSFQSLTLANGVFIVVAFVGLALLLSRILAPVPAILLSAVIVAGSACQHTIIWYNVIGAVAVVIAAVGTAKAPIFSRQTWGIHLLVAVVLFISGMNKINFHAIALVAAMAWTVRAGWAGQHRWPAVGLTLTGWLAAGLLLPVAADMWISGTTWSEWKTNVIILPFAERGDTLSYLLNWSFYLRPLHDYYGPVIQPVGLIVLVWAIFTAALAWRGRSLLDRLAIIGATLFVVAATGGLMATNHEIVYVSLVVAIGMILSIWVGFGLYAQKRWFNATLVAPAVGLGLVMLYSAWLGQRSQFGHSDIPREAYMDIGKADAVFSYLEGTKIPPELAESLLKLRTVVPPSDAEGIHSCFFATGAEFLERFWPNRTIPKMPPLLASLSLAPAQATALRQAFDYPSKYEILIGMEAWTSSWPGDLHFMAARNSQFWHVGVFQVHRFTNDWLRDGLSPKDDAIAMVNSYSGNLDPSAITVDDPLWALDTPSGRPILGTHQPRGSFSFHLPSNRISGTVSLQRTSDALDQPVAATFSVFDGELAEGAEGSLIWTSTYQLAPGEQNREFEYHLDSRNRPTRFVVGIAEESLGHLRAGYYLPRIGHSDSTPRPPPTLRKPVPAENDNPRAIARALLPPDWVEHFEVVARGVELRGSDVVLRRGGELWLKPTKPINEFHGQLSLTAPPDQSGAPLGRGVWYRGGRIEIQMQSGINPPDRPYRFKFWPAEQDGWYGVFVDPAPNPHGLKFEIVSITAP